MTLATNLPTNKADRGPDHTAGHNVTNARVNEIATEVNAHEAATDPHADRAFATTAVATHAAVTTSVHGITDTSSLETATGSAAKVTAHSAASDPHADRAFATTAVATHAAVTTSVHGITDTSALATTAAVAAAYQPINVTILTATGNGSADDTSSINAQLAAGSSGSVLRGVPGKTYKISAPLALRAGGQQTLDMTGCTITLAASTNLNMLNNAAVSAARTVMDATATATSTTLTSATASFVAGDVGKQVFVWGAGTNGAPLDTTIASVTNGTTAVLTVAAVTTVTGATASIGTRDQNVTVRGGTWARASNTGSGTAAHSLRFRRLDGLAIEDVTVTSSAGKYMINAGDVTRLRVRGVTAASASDIVHINGPALDIRISQVSGTSGDDSIALTCNDYAAYADVYGPISDVAIRDIRTVSTKQIVKVLAGLGCRVRGVLIDGVFGSSATSPVGVCDDTADAGTTGSDLDGITVRNVDAYCSSTASIILLTGAGIGCVEINGVRWSGATITAPVIATSGSGTTIERLTCRAITYRSAGGNRIVSIPSGSTVTDLLLYDVLAVQDSAHSAGRVVNISGTITNLWLSRIRQVDGNATVFNNGTLGSVHLTGITGSSSYVVRQSAASSCEVYLSGIDHTGSVLRLDGGSGGGAVVRGAGIDAAAATRSATESARFLSTELRADVSILARTLGDTAYNTNGALACGAGPVISDGTSWKHLYSGSTYT